MLRFQISPIPGSRRVPMTVELVKQAPPLHSFLNSLHVPMVDLASFNTTGTHKSFITIHLDSPEIQLDCTQNFYIKLYLGNIALSKAFQYGLLTHVHKKLWCIVLIEELLVEENDHQFSTNDSTIDLLLEDESLLSFDVVPGNEKLVDLLHMRPPEAITNHTESQMSELLTSRYFRSLYLDTSSLQIFIKSSLVKYRNISSVDKHAKLAQFSTLIIDPSMFDKRHVDENITSPENFIIHKDEPSYRTQAFKENSHSLDDLIAIKLREVQHQVLLLLEMLNLLEFDHIPSNKPTHVPFKSRIRGKRQLVPTLIGTVIEKDSSSIRTTSDERPGSTGLSNEALISKYLTYIDKLLVYDAINSQRVTYTFYKLIYPYYIKQLPTLLKHLYTKIKGTSPEKISLKRKKPSNPPRAQKTQSQSNGDRPIPVALKRTGSALSDMQRKMFDMSTHHKEKEKSTAPPFLHQQVDSFIFSKPKKSLSLAPQIEIQQTPKKSRIQVKETPIKQLKPSPEEQYIMSLSPTKPSRLMEPVTPTPSPKKTRPGDQIALESSPCFQATPGGEYENEQLVSSPVFSDASG